MIYFFLGNDHIADSLNSFHAAWQAGALDKRIFYFSGILYEELSLFEESIKQYRKFLNHEPSDRHIRLRFAKLLYQTGRLEEAVQEYEVLVKKNEKDVTSLINLGLAFKEKYEQSKKIKKPAAQELEQALAYLTKAAKLQPKLAEGVHLAMAKLYFLKEDYDKSIASCKAELKVAENSIECLKLLARAYEKSNQKKEALETYQQLSQKEPRNSLYKQKVRSLQAQMKRKAR